MAKRKERSLSDSEACMILNCIRVAKERFLEDAKVFATMLENGQANDDAMFTAAGAKRMQEQFTMQAADCDKLDDLLQHWGSIVLCDCD